MNKYLEKLSKDLYAHATSEGNLLHMLKDGEIKSVRHLSVDSPETEVIAETLPIPFLRQTGKVSDVHDVMRRVNRDSDSIFLTRNRYLPTYGDHVIVKKLTHPLRRVSLNTIPDEYTTKRRLSLRSNATIYVPDDKVDWYTKEYPQYTFLGKNSIPIPETTLLDRMVAYPNKLAEAANLVKIASLPVNPRHISRNALLSGSEGLGISLDGSSDVDIFVPYVKDSAYYRAIEKAKLLYPELKERASTAENPYKTTLSGIIRGKEVDLVFGKGEKALKFKEAYLKAKSSLAEKRRLEILAEKSRLKNAWVLPETRYALYKRDLANELGLKEHYF